ncbi:MAG: DUF1846 domain-containing protein [Firmicutes bacterium]|nr:DUF1846 domain-containing protein [Bacillota bacterium]
MVNKIGFDPKLYMELQTKYIRERIDRFAGKLYLEFGGKLFDDLHAARVLPGFEADAKIKLLCELKDITEIIFCISAPAIEKNKIRADIGITYDMDVLRLVRNISAMGLSINSVVITQYSEQPAARQFEKKLQALGIRTYIHSLTRGYPSDVATILSDEGYGANPFIETSKPLVVVTAPGPGSGKLATCLSQIYHENKRGVKAGYAKFETFPIWNLPLKHPVNLAYEAATADLHDVNTIDPYHFEKYGEVTVNYNRDIEAFPIVKTMLDQVLGEEVYFSPTDMGVNMAGRAIIDDEAVREAASQEIVRRWFKACSDARLGVVDQDIPDRIQVIMQQLSIHPEDRAVVQPARDKARQRGVAAIAFELPDGRITTGRDSSLMSASASGVLNAIKALAGIPDQVLLLSQSILDPITELKRERLHILNCALDLSDVLIALSICSTTNYTVKLALDQLCQLQGCEAHSTNIISAEDEALLRRLGVNITCDPVYDSHMLTP